MTNQDYRIYWDDTDAGGVVYHGNYLRLMDRGRTDWLRARGVGQAEMQQQHVIVVVRSIRADFRAPARLDDMVRIATAVDGLKRASATLTQKISRGDTTLVMAHLELAFLDSTHFRPVRLPAAWVEAITAEKPL